MNGQSDRARRAALFWEYTATQLFLVFVVFAQALLAGLLVWSLHPDRLLNRAGLVVGLLLGLLVVLGWVVNRVQQWRGYVLGGGD